MVGTFTDMLVSKAECRNSNLKLGSQHILKVQEVRGQMMPDDFMENQDGCCKA